MNATPGFFRRNWLRLLLGLVVVIVAVVVTGYVLFQRGLRGPPLPACAAPALPRKAFDKPTQVSGPKSPGRYGNEPGAALLPSGALAIAYQAQSGFFDDNGLGVVVIGTDGRVEERVLKSDSKRHYDAWMTADPKGTLHLVWLGHDGGRPAKRSRVGYATSRDGLSWTIGPAVNDKATDCPDEMPGCLDKTMVTWAGEAALVFYFSEASESLKAVRVTEGGKTVGPSVGVGSGAYADVKVAPGGAVHVSYVTWSEPGVDRFGDRRIRVEVVRSDDGGRSFGKPVRVSAEDEAIPFYFSNPQVAFDDTRNLLYVVYPVGERDGRWAITLATSADGGKSWSRTRVNDDAPCANHMIPSAVLDPKTGQLHVIWLENRTGRGGVAYAACEPGGARCSPNEIVSEAPFAAYTFARHRPEWVGEYPALVLDDERRTLHAVWAQPVDEDSEAVSRLFHARAKL